MYEEFKFRSIPYVKQNSVYRRCASVVVNRKQHVQNGLESILISPVL
jgi:hypothetical protein